jgi:hypothetical protein
VDFRFWLQPATPRVAVSESCRKLATVECGGTILSFCFPSLIEVFRSEERHVFRLELRESSRISRVVDCQVRDFQRRLNAEWPAGGDPVGDVNCRSESCVFIGRNFLHEPHPLRSLRVPVIPGEHVAH